MIIMRRKDNIEKIIKEYEKLKEVVKEKDLTISDLKKRLETIERNLKTVMDENTALKKALAEREDIIKRLLDEIQKLKATKQEIRAIPLDELSETLKRTLSSLTEKIEKIPKREGLRYIVDSFVMEIRSGIHADREGIKLVQPREITPEALSTIRFSIKAIPTIKIAKEK